MAKRFFQEIETVMNKAKNKIKNKRRRNLLKGGVQSPTDALLICKLIHREFPSGLSEKLAVRGWASEG